MRLLSKKAAPNVITVLRLLAVVPLIYFTPSHPWTALFILVPAALSDSLDGWLARRWRAQTQLGDYLDPIADKVLYLVMLLRLVYVSVQVIWILAITAPLEAALIAIRLRPLNRLLGVKIPATEFGKIKMVTQSTAISVMLLGLALAHHDTIIIGAGIAAGSILLSWKSLRSHFDR